MVALEPEPREPASRLGGRHRPRRERLEEVALEPALRLGDRARLRQLDREQGERVAGDDPVDRRERLRLADREEGFDAALRADRLEPHVVTVVDEREAEAGPLRTRAPQLLPHARRALARLGRRGGERDPVQVEQQRPPAGDARERGGDPLDPLAVHHGARENAFRVDGALEHVVLLVQQSREHRLGDRDERDRVGHLEQREPRLLGGGDERSREPLVAEPEAEPEPGQTGIGETAHVGPLLAGGRTDPGAGREQELAALQPRRRVLELADVDPPDRPVLVRLAGDGPQGEARNAEDVANGEGHRAIVRGVQTTGDLGGHTVSDWTGRTKPSPDLGPRTA